ncbi:hypothetical protein ONZ45_g5010 [Pleurotus djamor]|nr:hypothetical protein ONZ45_g5010 [Pleurotus djamor]
MARFTLVVLLTFVASVTASALIARSANDLGSLFARQSTILDPDDIPSACRSDCTSIVSQLNSCTTMACLCTTSNGRGLESCVNCLVDLSPSAAMRQQGQSILDNFVTGCSGAVPPLTVGGSSSATVSSSASSTPSTSPPALTQSSGGGGGFFPGSTSTTSTTTTPLFGTSTTPTGPRTTIDSGSNNDNPFDSSSGNGANELATYGLMTFFSIVGGAGFLLL